MSMTYEQVWLDSLSEEQMLKMLNDFLEQKDVQPLWEEHIEELYQEFLHD